MKATDISGLKFGKLTVIERVEDYISPKGKRHAKWNCICDCGNKVTVLKASLTCGDTKSCGCLKRVAVRKHFGCMYCGSDKHYAKGYCRSCYQKLKRGTLE